MSRKLWIGLPILAAILATGVGVALSKHEMEARDSRPSREFKRVYRRSTT